MLGWEIIDQGEYKLPLPKLSEEEKEILSLVEDSLKHLSLDEKEKNIKQIFHNILEENALYVDHSQYNYLLEYIKKHLFGMAFFEYLLDDDNIEEISVIGLNKPVYVFIRNVGWKSVNVEITSIDFLISIINKMSMVIGRRITLQSPRLDAILPSGARLHASIPPISEGEITIRKFRNKRFSCLELLKLETIDTFSLSLLSMIMQMDSSVIISGNTASGKTTMLNALFSFVPKNERILITEETPEIDIIHKHKVRLLSNKDMNISLYDLVYDSLRMRPDRIIVGEVRNKEEVNALFEVLFAGQARGTYATFHGKSYDEIISRFNKFGVDKQDIKSIDCFVVMRRILNYNIKTRKLQEIRKVIGIYDAISGVKIDKKTLFSSHLFSKILSNYNFSKKEFLSELKFREKTILNAPEGFYEFTNYIQNKFFK